MINVNYSMSLEKLPENLGGLLDLRELVLSYTAVTRLPSSLAKLTQLTVLKMAGCESLLV